MTDKLTEQIERELKEDQSKQVRDSNYTKLLQDPNLASDLRILNQAMGNYCQELSPQMQDNLQLPGSPHTMQDLFEVHTADHSFKKKKLRTKIAAGIVAGITALGLAAYLNNNEPKVGDEFHPADYHKVEFKVDDSAELRKDLDLLGMPEITALEPKTEEEYLEMGLKHEIFANYITNKLFYPLENNSIAFGTLTLRELEKDINQKITEDKKKKIVVKFESAFNEAISHYQLAYNYLKKAKKNKFVENLGHPEDIALLPLDALLIKLDPKEYLEFPKGNNLVILDKSLSFQDWILGGINTSDPKNRVKIGIIEENKFKEIGDIPLSAKDFHSRIAKLSFNYLSNEYTSQSEYGHNPANILLSEFNPSSIDINLKLVEYRREHDEYGIIKDINELIFILKYSSKPETKESAEKSLGDIIIYPDLLDKLFSKRKCIDFPLSSNFKVFGSDIDYTGNIYHSLELCLIKNDLMEFRYQINLINQYDEKRSLELCRNKWLPWIGVINFKFVYDYCKKSYDQLKKEQLGSELEQIPEQNDQ